MTLINLKNKSAVELFLLLDYLATEIENEIPLEKDLTVDKETIKEYRNQLNALYETMTEIKKSESVAIAISKEQRKLIKKFGGDYGIADKE